MMRALCLALPALAAVSAAARADLLPPAATQPVTPATPTGKELKPVAPVIPAKGQKPLYMTADQMGYDADRATVVARGRVEVVEGDYILRADTINYFQTQGVVEADGNVSLLTPDGNVIFAERMQLDDDMATGIIDRFRARLADNSRFAAAEAKKTGVNQYQLRKAVYSPCKICRDEAGKQDGDPFWQIKADRIQIDNTDQIVQYRNAFMEFYGVPVLYTPYFRHPTPGADRKSGLLVPEYSSNSQLGLTLKLPTYLNIAPNIDATLTPYLTSKEGPVMVGQYRQITDQGYYQFDGSITDPDKRDEVSGARIDGDNEIRGHMFTHGGSQISEHWGWGFDVNRTTDDTYLRRYKFGNQDTLTSRVFSERIENRDYIGVEALAFQGLREEDDNDITPYILPSAKVHVESDPLALGGRVSFDASGRELTRDIGSKSQRATAVMGYTVPFISRGGQIVEANAQIRTDSYFVQDNILPNGTEGEDETTRAIPQASLTWRYPLVRAFESSTVTLEPTAQLVSSTNGNNPEDIPNEDSLVPEFSDLNLFSTNRFPGYDRVENGTRGIYGLRGEYRLPSGQTTEAMLGQDIQLAGDRVFPVSDKLTEDRSDYVGHLGLGGQHYELDYRFRVDSDSYDFNRNEAHGGLNYDPVGVYVDYLDISDDPLIEERQEGMLSSTFRLTDQWSLLGYGRRDFDDSSMIAAGGGITFANECITIVTRLDREYLRDRDLQPDTSISVRLLLKNLE